MTTAKLIQSLTTRFIILHLVKQHEEGPTVQEIASDNGPQFISKEFVRENGISIFTVHHTIHPQLDWQRGL